MLVVEEKIDAFTDFSVNRQQIHTFDLVNAKQHVALSRGTDTRSTVCVNFTSATRIYTGEPVVPGRRGTYLPVGRAESAGPEP